MTRIVRLRCRKDFVRISAKGQKFITSTFILLGQNRADESPDVRIGFTVTKKLGNAPQRNRIRRRLREAIRLHAADYVQSGWDYVLIARKQALLCPFETVLRDIRFAFPRIGRTAPSPTRQPRA